MEITPVAPAALPVAPLEAQPVQPVVERQLFDYLAEVEKSGAGTLTDPSALAKAAMDSMGGMMEQAQRVFEEARKALPASEGAAPGHVEDATEATREEAATTPVTKNAGEPRAGDTMEKFLQQYVLVAEAALGAALATNSVAAASSSLSTLIKQQ